MRLKKTAIILLATTILVVSAVNYDADNEYVTVEEEKDSYTDPRQGRILWPYPLQKNESENTTETDTINVTDEPLEEEENERQRRFLAFSYRQSPVVDIMMQSLPPNYAPTNPNDPFDFLRDPYPLPKGNPSQTLKLRFFVNVIRYASP